jgi:hypothetical protein
MNNEVCETSAATSEAEIKGDGNTFIVVEPAERHCDQRDCRQARVRRPQAGAW